MTQYKLIVDALGGTNVIREKLQNPIDFINLSEIGIPKIALLKLAENLNSTVSDVANLVPISARTIQRKSNKDTFNKLVSEKILHIAQVAARGEEVFEDHDKFLDWLHQPSVALGNRSPFSLLASKYGADMVLDEIGKIEHGVMS